MWEVSVLSDSGREWVLVGDPHSPVGIKAGGMSGMVAKSAETSVTAVGRPGSRMVATRVESLAPSWDVVFVDRDGRGLGEVVAEWFAAWREGVTVTVGSSLGRLSTRGRLPADADEVFEFNPFSLRSRFSLLEVSWSWVADRPVWETEQSGSGAVEIINWGDVVVSPTVSWSGSGQSLSVNGATFTLPNVSVPAFMVLDHAENCVVRDAAGVKLESPSVWSRQRALDLSVVVPPGGVETVTGSAGVTVMWSLGVKSPWR